LAGDDQYLNPIRMVCSGRTALAFAVTATGRLRQQKRSAEDNHRGKKDEVSTSKGRGIIVRQYALKVKYCGR
jgi:hypothetical protein